MIRPTAAPEDAPRPRLAVVPPLRTAPSTAGDDVLASPPDIDLDDDTPILAPIRTDGDLDIGQPAFPNFPAPDIRLDTAFTAQPHYGNDGKGEPFTFRLQPGLAHLVTILVESPATPYRSKSDFIRDACYYLARAIRDLVNVKDQRLEAELEEAKVDSWAAHEARLQERVTKFEHALTDAVIGCLERNALAEACRQIEAAWANTLCVPILHRRRMYQESLIESPLIQAVLRLGVARNLPVPTAALAALPATGPSPQAVQTPRSAPCPS